MFLSLLELRERNVKFNIYQKEEFQSLYKHKNTFFVLQNWPLQFVYWYPAVIDQNVSVFRRNL